nr:hypothetical protein [Tanacetum cinerariifolium]
MLLQDSQNSKIQIYIKKEWMFRFEPLFNERQCYSISNFAITKNSDVIGSVVAIGDVIPVQSAASRKIRRTVVIEDSEYNVIMRIINQSGSSPIVFFNTMINKLPGYTAWELIERHGMDDSEDNFTTPANKIKVNNFTDDSLNRVLEMPPPSIEMGASGSGSVSESKVNNFTDNSLNRVLEMRTPSTEMGASRLASGSGRKRVFIELDEIDSEDEVKGCNSSNIQKIVRVKVEKVDP